MPETDQDLLLALSRGKPQAIAALYQRHGARMVAFAQRHVSEQSAAEDIVVGLLGRWLENPPQVREIERIGAFLATSVYHAAIDWIRRERAEQGQSPRGSRRGGSVEGRRKAPVVDVALNASRQNLEARLAVALERLSSADRLLLETHYGQALTPEECMAEMRITRAAFHQRLHRARTRLARLLATDQAANAPEAPR